MIGHVWDAACALPVSRDIYNWDEWDAALSDGKLSSCMLARGVLVKPWLPTEIKERRHWDISAGERFDVIKQFTRYGLNPASVSSDVSSDVPSI